MASNLASLIGVIGAGMAGYAKGKEQNAQNEIRQEQIEDRRRQRADAEALRKAAADIEPIIKEAASQMGPSAVMVGKQAFGSEGEAQAAADQQNTPQAKIQRQMGALIGQGRPDTALDLDEKAMKHSAMRQKLSDAMKAEGISDFIDGNMVRAPRVEDVEAGKAGAFDFNPDDVKKFNAVGGKVTIGEGQKGRWTTFEFPNGRKAVDFEVIDSEGKPVAPSARAIQLIAQMSVQSRDELADKQFEQGKRISVAQQGVDIQRGYKDGMLAVAQDRAQTYENGYGRGGRGSGAGGDPVERMHPADKLAYTEASGEAKAIQQAILKSIADGSWEPDPVKNPTQFDLLEQMDNAKSRASDILRRYSQLDDSAPAPKADPVSIRDTIESASPPAFDVRGDPAAFRKKLEGKVDASVLAAFDAKYPPAKKKTAKADVVSGEAAPPTQAKGPSVLQQLGALIPDGQASAAAAAEREAESLIRSGARAPLEALLKQNGSRLSEATKQRIKKLLAEKA